MKFEENLTTERIKRRYPSQFVLVNSMISEARNIIRTGLNPEVPIDTDNVAVMVYTEFQQGKEGKSVPAKQAEPKEVEEPIAS